jgi:hypothetical protein
MGFGQTLDEEDGYFGCFFKGTWGDALDARCALREKAIMINFITFLY